MASTQAELQAIVDGLDALVLQFATTGVARYSIGGREVEYHSIKDIVAARDRFAGLVAAKAGYRR